MAESIQLGIVGIKNMGDYNPQTDYEKLNVVTYQGSTYCALKNTKGNLPTNTEFWQLYAEKGSKGDTGDTGAKGDTPVKGVDYYTAADRAEFSTEIKLDVVSEVSGQLGNITEGTPLVASSIADMTDTTRIYVLTTDGHWYYYDGTSWQDGGAYQTYVDSSLAKKTNLEFIKTQGGKIFDDFKYGSVTQTLIPTLTTQTDFKYIILDINDIDDFMYGYSNETNNVLYKRSAFSSDGTRLTGDNSWIKLDTNHLINKSQYPATTKYIGITIIYSTDLTSENRVNNISLDNLFISNLNYSNVEEHNNLKQNINTKFDDYLGYNVFDDFNYGSMIAINLLISASLDKKKKYIKINASDLSEDLYIDKSRVNHNVFAYISLYNNGSRVFSTNGYVKKDNKSIIFRKSWLTTYTFDLLTITLCYSDENSYDNNELIENIPLNDVFLTPRINNIEERINLLNLQYNYNAIVDPLGTYGYNSINDAINNTSDGDSILIMPGTYNEDVRMWGKNRNLIGQDRDSCIIYSGTGLYDTPALECNKGKIKNLTIISGNDDSLSEDSQVNKSYGIHIEYHDANEQTLLIENCHVISYLNNAIGIGCRWNQTITIKDCLLESLATKFWSSIHNTYFACGGLLFHNDASTLQDPSQSNGKLNVINCEIRGKNTAIMAHSLDNGNKMTVKFIGNLAYKENQNLSNVLNFWPSGTKGNQPYLTGTDIILDNLSYNNNSDEIDYKNYWN